MLVSRAALLGDRDAFGRLVRLYQSPVRRFLFNLTGGDEELSKDLAQETFIKAWLNITSFRALSKFSTWLFRIAYNVFYDHTRSRKQTVDIDEIGRTRDIAVSKNCDNTLPLDMTTALQAVKEEERTVLLLFYMEDQSIETIAKIMNCPAGSVKSHLSRGREKLAAFLNKDGYR